MHPLLVRTLHYGRNVLPDSIRRIDARLHARPDASPPVWAGRVPLAAAAISGLVMFVVALRVKGPTIHPDEFGFLTNGQVLLGRNEAPLPTGSFYPAGYGLVTAAGSVVTGSMMGAYRFSLLFNLVLAVLTAVVATRLAIRGFGASRMTGLIAGALVFVTPGTLVSSMFSWAETAARLAFLGFVFLVIKATARRSVVVLTAVGLFVGLMPALHGRFVLLLPFTCLLFGWWVLRRDATFVAGAAGVGATSIGYAASVLLNRFVKSAVYLRSHDPENRLLMRITNYHLWGELFKRMVGQLWYLLATSYGLIGVGVACAVAAVWAGFRRRDVRTNPALVGYVAAVLGTGAVLFTGGLQLVYGIRGDHYIYGRYVEMMVPALLVLGCVGVERALPTARRAWLFTAVFALALATVYVVNMGGDIVKFLYSQEKGKVVFPNIVGVDFARYLVPTGIVGFALFFALVSLVLWFIVRRNGSLAVIALVVVFAFGTCFSGERTILGRADTFAASGATVQRVKESGAREVGFDMGVPNDRAYYYMRLKLHPVRVVRFDASSPDAVIPDYYTCIYGFPEKPPSQGDWQVVADEPALGRLLFQRIGSASC